MLSQQDNELVSRVGPGTLMGNVMREYWLQALEGDIVRPKAAAQRVRPKAAAQRDTSHFGFLTFGHANADDVPRDTFQPAGADRIEATEHLRQAYVDHPELDPTLARI
jgi:hypothetical protein